VALLPGRESWHGDMLRRTRGASTTAACRGGQLPDARGLRVNRGFLVVVGMVGFTGEKNVGSVITARRQRHAGGGPAVSMATTLSCVYIRLAYYRRRTGEDWWEYASQMTVCSDVATIKTLIK
jgi:hypothetical protein